MLSSKKEIEHLAPKNVEYVHKSINDYVTRAPSSNLDILKHLEKTKESKELNEDSSGEQESDNDSFHMVSRKKDYDEKIQSSKYLKNIII
jgi:hypothetical protein